MYINNSSIKSSKIVIFNKYIKKRFVLINNIIEFLCGSSYHNNYLFFYIITYTR